MAVDKYLSLLRPYADVEIVTVKEEVVKNKNAALSKEASRILTKARHFVLLSERGRLMDSEEFAGFIDKRRDVTFVIGGPYGVAESVYEQAETVLSLSPMTFTHEMSRIILLEQLYRAITIIKGTRYHH